MKIEDIALIAHEVNRAYCVMIGDDSQLPWADVAAWQRDGVINGVQFHIANPDADPESGHAEWLKQTDVQTHPRFVRYAQLPTDQRAKDHIFRAVVHACLKIAS